MRRWWRKLEEGSEQKRRGREEREYVTFTAGSGFFETPCDAVSRAARHADKEKESGQVAYQTTAQRKKVL